MTQDHLDALLNREHIIPIEVSRAAPLPQENVSYDTLRALVETGLSITTRHLIHAIGSKLASLPSSRSDECLQAGYLYCHLLDLENKHLCFKPGIDSDLQTPRSQEVGIGMMCLLVHRAFGVPWDQLGSLPGRGLRFDYRGSVDGFDGIFESKGTSHRRNQTAQVQHGLKKKVAHHQRGEEFDAELIVATFVGRRNDTPRIVVGDPSFGDLKELYSKAGYRFFRLRHYSRVLQFIGLSESAFILNQIALSLLKGEMSRAARALRGSRSTDNYSFEMFGGAKYFGRWFESAVPQDSRRYPEERYGRHLIQQFGVLPGLRVFHGLREDVFQAGFEEQPFAHELLSGRDVAGALEAVGRPASILADGTLELFDIRLK